MTIYLIIEDLADDQAVAAYTSNPSAILTQDQWIQEIELEELDAEKITSILAERAEEKIRREKVWEAEKAESRKRQTALNNLLAKQAARERKDEEILRKIKSGELKVIPNK